MAHIITYTRSRAKLAALGQADRAGRGIARLEANEELAKLAGMMLARYPHLTPSQIEEMEKEAGIKFLGGLAKGIGGRVAGFARKLFKGAPKAVPKVVKRPRVQTRRVGWRQRRAQIRAQQQPPSQARLRRRAKAGLPQQPGPTRPARGGVPYKVTPPPPAPTPAVKPGPRAVRSGAAVQPAPKPTTATPSTPAPAAAAPKKPRLVKRKRGIQRRAAPAQAAPAQAAPAQAPVTSAQAPTARGSIEAPGTLKKAPRVVQRTRGGRLRARQAAPGSRAGAAQARAPGQAAPAPKIAPGQAAPTAAPATAARGTVARGPAATGAAAEQSPGFLRRWWKPLTLAGGAAALYGAGKAGGAAIRMMEQSRQSPWAYGAAWSPTQYGYGPTPYGQFHQSMGM